jgi:hypothetical protein
MEEKNKTIRDGFISSINVESSLNQPHTMKGSCARRTVFFPLIVHSVCSLTLSLITLCCVTGD